MISKLSLSWASRDRSVEDPGLPASPIWWNGRKGMRHEEAKGGQEGDQTLSSDLSWWSAGKGCVPELRGDGRREEEFLHLRLV